MCVFFSGDDNTHTCCSIDQVRGIKSSVRLAETILKKCPACYYNFLNLICQVACSPYQSEFMWRDMDAEKPSGYTDGVPAVNMLVSQDFANGLYESCDSVIIILSLKAMDTLCGGKDCNPLKFLTYMGGTGNGHAPFPINYMIGDSWIAPDNTTLQPLNTKSARCNHIVEGSSDYIGKWNTTFCWPNKIQCIKFWFLHDTVRDSL